MRSCTCHRCALLTCIVLSLLALLLPLDSALAQISLLPSTITLPSTLTLPTLSTTLSSALPSALPSTISSVIPSLTNLSSLLSNTSNPIPSSSTYTLFGTSPYTGAYTSTISLMTASVPSFWRVSLSLPPSITPTLVELHLLLSSNPTQSFIQPPSTTSATSPTSTTFGSAAYSPITHPQQLLAYFPSSNAALNFSLSSSSTTSFLSALFNANPSEAVQLNYLMKEEGGGVWDVGYVAFQPYLNQTLWYYYTLHTEKGGLDTDWQSMGADEGVEASPTSPPATLSGAEAAVIDDSSNPMSATVVFEQSFAWEAGVIRAVTGPTPPGGGGDGGGRYRIAFATNVSHAVLWLNVEWAVDGVVVKSSMTGLSSTQWVSPTLTLTPSDVLIYNFTWWALADNAEVVSPLHFLYRLPTTDASALTASATAGASRLPGGKVLGDGQSLWGNLAASTPSFPAMSLPHIPIRLSTIDLRGEFSRGDHHIRVDVSADIPLHPAVSACCSTPCLPRRGCHRPQRLHSVDHLPLCGRSLSHRICGVTVGASHPPVHRRIPRRADLSHVFVLLELGLHLRGERLLCHSLCHVLSNDGCDGELPRRVFRAIPSLQSQ